MSYRTESVRIDQESRDHNLPKILTRFTNSHQSLYSYQGKHNETEGNLNKKDPQPKSLGYMLNKNMDVNALEHL